MTFLNELWKKLKTTSSSQDEEEDVTTEILEPESSTKTAQKSALLLKNFADHETEYLQSEQVLNNLKSLKAILEGPKEAAPNRRADQINQLLGIPESYETLRQERWDSEIQCPSCRSINLKRITPVADQSIHNHRYRCLNCLLEFTDDTGTPIETGVPPVNVWMQCWYLMGCTDSLIYIASKLNLDLATVERMVEQLKKIFQSQKPATNTLDFDEWDQRNAHLRKQLTEDLMKHFEVLDANVSTAPKDTSEFRRQQNLRRNLKASTDPLNPKKSPNLTKKR